MWAAVLRVSMLRGRLLRRVQTSFWLRRPRLAMAACPHGPAALLSMIPSLTRIWTFGISTMVRALARFACTIRARPSLPLLQRLLFWPPETEMIFDCNDYEQLIDGQHAAGGQG